jgi:hypothetical protein
VVIAFLIATPLLPKQKPEPVLEEDETEAGAAPPVLVH